MRHSSIKLDTPCEFINVVPVNPLISKCQIKVCYVGEDPNRNKSIITKEVAKQIANTLPGSPIVGFYNEQNNDFEEHSRDIRISNNKIKIVDITRPYGFVDMNAKCWFQKFLDDGLVEREYLMTEGYIWAGQYPEAQRIINQGNNQSLEFNRRLTEGFWTRDENGKPQFFIINKAVIDKLCILGDDAEPCFEGCTITGVQDSAPTTSFQFSLDDDLMKEIRSMICVMSEILKKQQGGAQVFTKYSVTVGDALWTALYSKVKEEYNIAGIFEDDNQKYAVLQSKNDEKKFSRLNFSFSDEEGFSAEENMEDIEFSLEENLQFSLEDIAAFESEFKKKNEDEDKEDNKKEDKDDKSEDDKSEDKSEDDSEDKKDDKDNKEEDKDDEDKKKKTKYSLEEIPEYVELASKYSTLESRYNTLLKEKETLESQLQPLQQFKLNAERTAKEDMINKTFYMLSDEDKKDVIDNINTYSLDDIEAKLSIICFRNKINLSALESESSDSLEQPTTYNLNSVVSDDGTKPAWVKAVLETAKTLN